MKMRVTLLLSFIVLLVAYQNCSPVRFEAQQIFGSSFRADNNGTGYGGKPEGEFYRFHPDFTCEDKASPVSKIHITDTEIHYTEHQKLQCGAIQQTIDPDDVDISIYQSDVIGYKEGIFESQAATPSSIPANLVEVWCRTAKDSTGIETITHFNRSSSQADTEIYHTKDATAIKQTLSVSRVISNLKITVADGKGFRLEVYRDQPAAELGLFKGSLSAIVDEQKVSVETSCRLGGMLDARIWPATQIVDSSVQLFKVSPDLNFFGYTAANGSEPSRLFYSDAQGTNQKSVSPPMLQSGVPNFEIAPNLKSFVFWGDPRLAGGAELFSVDRDDSALFQLNQPIVQVEQAKATEIRFTPDGSRVLYRDGEQETGGDIEMWLRAVPLTGGAPVIVNPPLPIGGDIEVNGFGISKRYEKVAYLVGRASSSELYLSNLDGSDAMKPPIGITFNWYADLQVPEPGEYVFIPTLRQGAAGRLDSVLQSVSVKTGVRRELPANWNLQALNPQGHIALIADASRLTTTTQPPGTMNETKLLAVKLMDLQTGSLTTLPALNQPYFTKDSGALIGSKLLANGRLEPVMFSTGQSTEEVLCAGVSGTEVSIKEFGSDGFVIAAYDEGTQILNFVVRNSAGSCAVKNSVPVENPSIRELTIAPDEKKVLLKASLTRDGKAHDQVFYVPLTGEAPLAVNTAVYLGATISSVQFLNDSRSVIYLGDQVSPSRKGVFLWRAP